MYLIKSNSLTVFFGTPSEGRTVVDVCKGGMQGATQRLWIQTNPAVSLSACWLRSPFVPTSTRRQVANSSSQISYVTDQPPEDSLTLNSSPKKKGQLRPGLHSTDQLSSGHVKSRLLQSVIMCKGKAFSQQMATVGWGLRLDSLDKVWHGLGVRAKKNIGVWYYTLQLSCETFSILKGSFVPGLIFLGLFK